VWVCDLH
jgi:hypothetical protein